MIAEYTLLAITSSFFVVAIPLLWYFEKLTIGKTVILLFVLDIAMTIEAAFYSDIILIALLHVITIPSFFALIYLDLVQQHKTKFRCFVCGKNISEEEKAETVKRLVSGQKSEISVHSICIDLERHQRKSFSSKSFRSGIPE